MHTLRISPMVCRKRTAMLGPKVCGNGGFTVVKIAGYSAVKCSTIADIDIKTNCILWLLELCHTFFIPACHQPMFVMLIYSS